MSSSVIFGSDSAARLRAHDARQPSRTFAGSLVACTHSLHTASRFCNFVTHSSGSIVPPVTDASSTAGCNPVEYVPPMVAKLGASAMLLAPALREQPRRRSGEVESLGGNRRRSSRGPTTPRRLVAIVTLTEVDAPRPDSGRCHCAARTGGEMRVLYSDTRRQCAGCDRSYAHTTDIHVHALLGARGTARLSREPCTPLYHYMHVPTPRRRAATRSAASDKARALCCQRRIR